MPRSSALSRYRRAAPPYCVTRPLPARPDLVAIHQAFPQRYPHLLESAARGPHGRYDILFAFPGESLVLSRLDQPDFFRALDDAWARQRLPHADDVPPFRGGWFLFLGYELAGQVEPRLRPAVGATGWPLAFATRFPAAILHDRALGRARLVVEPDCEHLLAHMARDIAAATAQEAAVPLCGPVREDDPARFLKAVRRTLRYIREGDAFQVNLSRAWSTELREPLAPAVLYRRLRETNPAPFAGLCTWDGAALICSSPERLVRVSAAVVETRPIAGTHPRAELSADAAACAALLAHPKERAEHIMLIDLERNDLGRVCHTGSVEVNECLTLESYAHVHHIVSNVRGRLRPGTTPGQVLRAVFPGGTITGCPKLRAMEIIAELEQVARGPYTGAMGYLNRDGDLDLNILIRTLVQRGRQVSLRAGAGIVADSVPERELAETRAKAKGLLLALGAA